MRRATLLVLATIAVMLLATGVALAKVMYGGPGNDTLKGTKDPDAINGRAGNDTLYGESGNDNFKNVGGYKDGKAITAGLRGAAGDDTVYGQEGDDDVIGHKGNDTLDDSTPENKNDWDRAFGGQGKDTIKVADGDTRDEVSCGEDTTSTTHIRGDSEDTVTIDVNYAKNSDGTPVLNPDGTRKIDSADKVYEYAADNTSTECEKIKDKADNTVTQNQLPQSDSAVAAVEPSEQ